MASTRVDQLFDTIDRSYDAAFDAARAGNERVFRFNRMVMEEAQRTQRERSALGRRWAEAPFDVVSLSNVVLETWTKRQRRRMELARSFLDDMAGMRDETREMVRRVADVNRTAVGVGVSAGSQAVSRAGQAVSRAGEEVSERAADVSERAADVSQRAAGMSERAADVSGPAEERSRRNSNGGKK